MGDECPRPGTRVRQSTFCVSDHVSGYPESAARPWPEGPRHRGHDPEAAIMVTELSAGCASVAPREYPRTEWESLKSARERPVRTSARISPLRRALWAAMLTAAPWRDGTARHPGSGVQQTPTTTPASGFARHRTSRGRLAALGRAPG